MKQRYTVGRYVSAWHCDSDGTKSDLYIPEVEIAYRIICGRPLVLYPCVEYVRKVDLGIVRKVRNAVKHSEINPEILSIKTNRLRRFVTSFSRQQQSIQFISCFLLN